MTLIQRIEALGAVLQLLGIGDTVLAAKALSKVLDDMLNEHEAACLQVLDARGLGDVGRQVVAEGEAAEHRARGGKLS